MGTLSARSEGEVPLACPSALSADGEESGVEGRGNSSDEAIESPEKQRRKAGESDGERRFD
jgi:hypothetical protein